MSYLKIFIAAVAALAIALILFMVLTFDPADELNNVQSLFLSGNLEEASQDLDSMQSSIGPMHYHLYKAYVERAGGRMEQSSQELSKAEQEASEHANFPLLLEILLNQAYNAYLEHNAEALKIAVRKAAKYGGPDQDWVALFRGIMDYQNGNYAKALHVWKLDAPRLPLSAWMGKSFGQTFTNYWLTVRVARSEIETGRAAAGRQMLEEQIPILKGDELNTVLFLIGYSYAKDAAAKAPLEAIPYYKLAFSYFHKMPFMADEYKPERAQLVKQIAGQIESILQGGSYQNLLAYIGFLDELQAKAEIEGLKGQLIEQFKRSLLLGIIDNAKEVYAILQLMIPEGAERQSLEQALQESIARETLQDLDQYARSGKLMTEPLEWLPAPQGDKALLADPVAELLPIQQLLEKAIDDHKINAMFNVERSVDLQKALKLLLAFVESHPEITPAYVMLGQVRYLLGDFSGAVKAYEAAIRLDPRNFQIYRYLALVYEAVGQAQDAILILLQSLKYAPKNADIWEQLGLLYLFTGNDLDALPSFKEALHIDPERYEVYLTLGRLEGKLEMPEEARVHLQKYLAHNPESKEALRLLLMALYNPLLNVQAGGTISLEAERREIYERLHQIDPEAAEKIRKGYSPPPPVVSPPPEPEPNLPFLPQ